MKKAIAIITLPLLLTACQSTGNSNTSAQMVSPTDLQHHNWSLSLIDGKPINTPENMQSPNLEIGEKMTANGNAGCNNFFGEAELENNKFRIPQMGMTMKMCVGDVMDTEMTVGSVLTDWSDITLTKDNLVLSNETHSLTFVLADWKQ
jgi:heat shock protein HslJ